MAGPDRSTGGHALSRGAVLGLIVALIAVAAGELLLISHREIWLDESHTWLLATMPAHDLLTFVKGDVHPPLYFLLEAAWVRAFGDSAMALRLPSVLAHIAGTIVFFLLARRLCSARPARFAAALFLFNPALYYYSSEARGYLLAVLWVTATVLCVVTWEQAGSRRARRMSAAGVILFGAAAIYTHYVALFVVAALLGTWFIKAAIKHESPATVFGVGLMVCLLVAPWVPVLLRQQRTKTGLVADRALATQTPGTLTFGAPQGGGSPLRARLVSAAEDLASIAGVYPERRTIGLALAALPVVLLGVAGVFGSTRRSWLAVACVVVVIANVAGCFALGIEARRYLLLTAPFILLLLAFGAETGANSQRTAALSQLAMLALVVLNVAGIVHVLRTQTKSATVQSALAVSRAATDRDLIVFANAYAQIPFDYYARHDGLRAREDGFPLAIKSWWAQQPFKGWGSRVATTQQLNAYVAARRNTVGAAALWLVLYEDYQYDPSLQVPKAFLAGARHVVDYGHCGSGPGSVCSDSVWQIYRIEY